MRQCNGRDVTCDDYRNKQRDDGPMGDDLGGIDQHANGNKEDRAEHIADRLDKMFDFRFNSRLSHERPSEKRAERDGVIEGLSE